MLTRELLDRVRRLEIRTRKLVDHLVAGAYHSVFKGRGIEFHEVREYLPEDDARSIDWNVTARFARPFVKQYVEERELSVMLLVDISASGDFGSRGRSKNEQAAELAALLAFSAIRNNDRVGLLMFTSEPEVYLPMRKGHRHALRVIRELLAGERRRRQTDLGSALRRTLRILPRRAVIFLISDFLDSGYEKPLAVASYRHDLVAVRIADPMELDMPPPPGLLSLEDAESGRIIAFNGRSGEQRRNYRNTAARLREDADKACRKAKVDLIDIMVGQDVVEPLMKFFHARRKLR